MKKYMVAGAIPLVAVLLAAEEGPGQKPQMAKASTHKKVRASQGRHGERNGFFMGADYQLGMMSSTEQACSMVKNPNSYLGAPAQISSCDGSRQQVNVGTVDKPIWNTVWGNMGKKSYMGYLNGKSYVTNGFGVLMGYKHFFKKLPELGLRYYGFFDYAGTGYRYFKQLGGPLHYQQTNIFAYGVGTDILFNPKPFNKENFHFGFFLGVAIGGTSFGPTSKFFNQLLQTYGTHMRPSNFQFFVNGGLRVGSRHNGFEFGIKIPTIGTNYYYSNGAKAAMNTPYSLTLHRNFVFYWRYMVSF
ncbi:outer membrane protein [Helicobacter mehlei]|uniref:Outer membrane protein n=1 Tax=Helicobacter mehlei TaxID=2316080 RepID=A0A553UR44_9HELI|nr:outer membrane protein [Helicobacter mehlei]TSA82625.1 outer membrane protein [Helicobacter mehlei]